MKKYRLKIDYFFNIQLVKGIVGIKDETRPYYKFDRGDLYTVIPEPHIENNPDIFEEVLPIEIEGKIRRIDNHIHFEIELNEPYTKQIDSFKPCKIIIEE